MAEPVVLREAMEEVLRGLLERAPERAPVSGPYELAWQPTLGLEL